MACEPIEIARQFATRGHLQMAAPYGEGHINHTYLIKTSRCEYILQRINTDVFPHPEQVMENIVRVTDFLRQKILACGGDPLRETLTLIPTHDGQWFARTAEGDVYRMYRFVSGTTSYQVVEDPHHFYCAAKAFGRFQTMLSDFPADELHETIPNFHNTRSRFADFARAVEEDKLGRKKEVLPEIEFAMARQDMGGLVVDALADGSLPLRVTHNDTKLNNVLIDDASGEGICVIDLDTVMPGSLLYDFGDSIRFGANLVEEDEQDLSKVCLDLPLFEQYTKGFLEAIGDSITQKEIDLLPESAILMTLECGIRFLGDHLNGDTYFRIHRPGQNLDRARTQLKLVADMENRIDEMREVVKKYV